MGVEKSDSFDNVMVVLAAVAVLLALVGAGFSYFRVSEFSDWMTGFATETATINITISTNAVINFTTDNLNFGAGSVNQGQSSATINTDLGTVVQGSWTPIHRGLILENIGNVNATVDINGGKNSTTLLGGTSPVYEYNISNNDTSMGCLQPTSGMLNVWREINTSQIRICGNLSNSDTSDQLVIHFKLTIPSDAKSGDLSDIITVTYVGQ